MFSTSQKFTVLLPFPTEHPVFKAYIEWVNFIQIPPLAFVVDYIIKVNNSTKPITIPELEEWLEYQMLSCLYEAIEVESYENDSSAYDPYAEIPTIPNEERYPKNHYLQSLNNPLNCERFYELVRLLAREFDRLYGAIVFPEDLVSLDPFYTFEVAFLNQDTVILEITEIDDVEALSELYLENTSSHIGRTQIHPTHSLPKF